MSEISSTTTGKGSMLLKRLLHHPATAWVVLFASFLITAVAWQISDKFVQKRMQDRFLVHTEEVRSSLVRRMLEYEATLRGGVGLFGASDVVKRHEWRTYAQNLQLERYYPGIQGFGFSLLVAADERAHHERQLRAEGFPEYRIKPEGARQLYTSIIYLEPFVGRNLRAFGYDMYSEPVRRAAMQMAWETGQPAVSGRVTLVQETETDVQHGILMYLPVYLRGLPTDTVQQRKAALFGFVYAPFRMRDLMQGILGAGHGDIAFELYDGTLPSAQTLLYQTHSGPLRYGDANFSKTFDKLRRIEIGGRTWSLYLYAHHGFIPAAEANQPLLVALGGVLIDLLLFFIIASIAKQKKYAEALAKEMTLDLQRSNADLEQFAYAAAHDMRQPLRMITSYMQLIEAEIGHHLTDEAQQNFRFATEGAKYLDQLLDALLEYSTIGRTVKALIEINTGEALNEALQYLKPVIEETAAEVTIKGDWPRLFADRHEMVSLFQNLIENALKYHREGFKPKVLVSAQAEANEWRFTVSDDGIGLIPGQEKRLFKVFERLHPRSRYSGTGIGLALCRKIVEHHGGRIWAESPGENMGCAFIFTIPTRGA